jgi:hypothetical protein
MKLSALCLILGIALSGALPAGAATLTPFGSDAELADFLRKSMPKPAERSKQPGNVAVQKVYVTGSSIAAAPPAAPAKALSLAASDSVTNVQTAGIDEGGIVKNHGRHLVILRRGRLFTVDVGGNRLAPVSTIDAFAPGAEAHGDWYDEMLISGNTVVVIGYSYSRGGTEIGLFNIDEGRLSYRATYHMRSNDYYSSRNYASRLIGNKLVFYTPLTLNPWHGDVFGQFPAVRRWRHGAPEEFRRIAPAHRIYRSGDDLDPYGATLHSVTTCTIAGDNMDCKADAVLGPRGRVFYVSESAVYVWTVNRGGKAALFRMPLEGQAPSALRAVGSPIDQFSFLESSGQLNVLLRRDGRGDGMWAAERPASGMALLRVPLQRFGDAAASAGQGDYAPLPAASGYGVQNRFVGRHLLYGSNEHWHGSPASLHTLRWDRPDTVTTLVLPHAAERIEVMGDDALVAGSAGEDLHITGIKLDGTPSLGQRHVQRNAAQSETRSHGFYYKPLRAGEGIAALPVRGNSQASVLYLRNDGDAFHELGSLHARPGGPVADDRCVASCVDWYGNARPLFLGGRIFALLSYEIVEGQLQDGRLHQLRRTSFAPVRR